MNELAFQLHCELSEAMLSSMLSMVHGAGPLVAQEKNFQTPLETRRLMVELEIRRFESDIQLRRLKLQLAQLEARRQNLS
jgi:hypothetical protein